jgi:hypothetical protein
LQKRKAENLNADRIAKMPTKEAREEENITERITADTRIRSTLQGRIQALPL